MLAVKLCSKRYVWWVARDALASLGLWNTWLLKKSSEELGWESDMTNVCVWWGAEIWKPVVWCDIYSMNILDIRVIRLRPVTTEVWESHFLDDIKTLLVQPVFILVRKASFPTPQTCSRPLYVPSVYHLPFSGRTSLVLGASDTAEVVRECHSR